MVKIIVNAGDHCVPFTMSVYSDSDIVYYVYDSYYEHRNLGEMVYHISDKHVRIDVVSGDGEVKYMCELEFESHYDLFNILRKLSDKVADGL